MADRPDGLPSDFPGPFEFKLEGGTAEGEDGSERQAPEFTITITQEIWDRARREGLSGAQMVALAIAEQVPGAKDVEAMGQNLWSPGRTADQ